MTATTAPSAAAPSAAASQAAAPSDAASQAAARRTARILIATKAIHVRPHEPFTLTSGRKSPVYIDCRRLISFPRERSELMDLAVALIDREIGRADLDAIAGGETAGIPFAAWIAERLDMAMLYVRKQPKGFGRMAQIEGDMPEGSRVLLVEDLATDAGSKVQFCNALRAAGAKVAHTFVIFHYGIFPQSIRVLSEIGVRLHALATWWDVLAEAETGADFDAAVLAEVKAYLHDPEGWSTAKGGA
ncbi:MAG: orotate phosphoribosyltransferase [Alphaproteobacteria bacterium]